ncbi:Sensor protein ZraS [Anatilimnocola aggregata]|uniref:histidine kinase n=1 Tax=Anatilimnocola aggregata TaxID=2528021 RepID=A0A517Y952_9BACT|nr:GAF domain-containing sensor histidine kinase [Anatilimnocola aggregata]QDU26753.1 Sensor protein ZraS [Anatilimnocola aggregata]
MTPDSHTRMEVAAEIGRWAVTDYDFESLLAQMAEAICEHLHVEFSSFLQLMPDGNVVFQAGAGWKEGIIGRATIEMGSETAAGYVIRTLTPLAISDLRSDDRFVVSPLLHEHGVVSTLTVPLLGQDRPLGVLGAHSCQPRLFTSEETAWLQVIASFLSARIERSRLSQGESNEKMLRAEQMMAIGQVAAGVAHELRNPLTSIKGLIQVNLRELVARGLPADDLAIIEHEIRRMEMTLQTFLDFARPPQPDRRRQEIGPIVGRVLALVGGRSRKQHVELKFQQHEPTAQAEIDADQIQQLLLNLVLNALDAMPQGGALEVELSPPRDGHLEVYVRDTGHGIAPQILPKVFETFVSSKETGVGLGLPLSRRIAEEHGGALTAYNLPLEGACFLLRLPVAPSERPDHTADCR